MSVIKCKLILLLKANLFHLKPFYCACKTTGIFQRTLVILKLPFSTGMAPCFCCNGLCWQCCGMFSIVTLCHVSTGAKCGMVLWRQIFMAWHFDVCPQYYTLVVYQGLYTGNCHVYGLLGHIYVAIAEIWCCIISPPLNPPWFYWNELGS